MIKKLLIFTFLICVCADVALASERYVFIAGQSKIHGSVRYSMVGKYRARFLNFKGVFDFDQDKIENSSVLMSIDVASLSSKFPFLDKIVRSKRLLDTARFPKATFQSKRFEKNEDRYNVTGDFTIHGVTKPLTFSFDIQVPGQDELSRYVKVSGAWKINRKDFDIVWSSVLDRAGILVGNSVIIDWEVKAKKTSR